MRCFYIYGLGLTNSGRVQMHLQVFFFLFFFVFRNLRSASLASKLMIIRRLRTKRSLSLPAAGLHSSSNHYKTPVFRRHSPSIIRRSEERNQGRPFYLFFLAQLSASAQIFFQRDYDQYLAMNQNFAPRIGLLVVRAFDVLFFCGWCFCACHHKDLRTTRFTCLDRGDHFFLKLSSILYSISS